MESTPDNAKQVSSETIKLIMENALLESEARTSTKLSTTLTDQNVIYMSEIVKNAKETGKLTARVDSLTEKVESHNKTQTERINGFKVMIGYVGTASVALGGLVGFFVSQITKGS